MKYKKLALMFYDRNLSRMESEKIRVGSRLRFNSMVVDAENHYATLMGKYKSMLDELRDSAETENIGVAFASFKNKDCVLDTIEQLDIIKNRLIGKPYYDRIGVDDWDAEPAYPCNDVIWSNLNKSYEISIFYKFLLKVLPAILSTVTIGILAFTDMWASHLDSEFWRVVFTYFLPTFTALFNFLLLPYVLFQLEKLKKHERKSKKEETFVAENTFYMITNSIFLPFLLLSLSNYYLSNYSTMEIDTIYPKMPSSPVISNG